MAKTGGKEGCAGILYQAEKGCGGIGCQQTDSLESQVIHNLLTVSRLHRKEMDNAFSKTELYGSQHRLLMQLAKCGSISQTEIAKSMEVTPATVAVALKKLEKGGYIRKVMDETDNRYNKIAVTEKGEQIILESIRIFHQTDEEFLKDFTKEELEQLNQFLLRMKGR